MPSLSQVVLLDKIDPSAGRILNDNGVTATIYEKFTDIPAELLANIDGLVVRSATKVTAEIMAQLPCLKIIGRAGTGVDNIDVPTATSRGVVVMNTPGGNTISAAEHTCYMIVSLARHATQNNYNMKCHKWIKQTGSELQGKTLGIIGLGRIGSEVAHRMQSYGMRTIGFDPIVSAEVAAKSGIEWMPLESLWPLCDYITVHTPLIPQTRDLVGAKSLPLCKKGVKIVNVARGGIVNEADLLAGLQSGQVGGAGLDVFEEEPPKDWTLVDHPNVVATSHLGASTKEAQLKCGQEIAQQFCDFAASKAGLVGVLNSPALVASLSAESAPYLQLVKGLSAVASALSDASSGQYTISASSTNTPSNLKSFAAPATFVGALLAQGKEGVNVVNAPGLASAAGITAQASICESSSSPLTVTSPSNVAATGHVDGSVAYLDNVDGASFGQGVQLNGQLFVGRLASDQLASLASAGLQSLAIAGDIVIGSASNPASLPAGLKTISL